MIDLHAKNTVLNGNGESFKLAIDLPFDKKIRQHRYMVQTYKT